MRRVNEKMEGYWRREMGKERAMREGEKCGKKD